MALRLLTSLTALVVLAAGCGGDDGPTPEEQAALDAYVPPDFSVDEQRCVLEGLRDLEIGPEQITSGDLTAEEDGELLARTVECVDDLGSRDEFVDAFLEGANAAGANFTREQALCAIDAIGTPEEETALLACLEQTVSDEEPDGDDPVLDLLSTQCRRGNNQACDELYLDAVPGSEYETYGRTCARRMPDGAGGTCFEELG